MSPSPALVNLNPEADVFESKLKTSEEAESDKGEDPLVDGKCCYHYYL